MKPSPKRKKLALVLGLTGALTSGYTLRLLYDLGVYADETGTSGFKYAAAGWSLALLSLLLLLSALLLCVKRGEQGIQSGISNKVKK